MLSQTHRFHGLGSLRHLYKNGRTVRGPNVSLRYNENVHRRTYRCAIVVSKKVQKSAVGRNRIRRRLYEIIRQQEPKIKKPYDMVLSVFSDSIAELPSAKLEKIIVRLLKDAEII